MIKPLIIVSMFVFGCWFIDGFKDHLKTRKVKQSGIKYKLFEKTYLIVEKFCNYIDNLFFK